MSHLLIDSSFSSAINSFQLTRFGKEFFSHALLPKDVAQLFKNQDWLRCGFAAQNKEADVSLLVSRVVYQLCVSQDTKIYSLRSAYRKIPSQWRSKSFKEEAYIASNSLLREIFIRVVDRNVTVEILVACIGRGGIKTAYRTSSFCFDWKNRQWKQLPSVVYSLLHSKDRRVIEGAELQKKFVATARDVSLYIAEPVEIVEGYAFRQKLYAGSLRNLLQGSLPLARFMEFKGQGPYFSLACDFVQKIGTAIEVLHRSGRVHADVKIDNIFIDVHKGQLSPVLADWDMAAAFGSQQIPQSYLYWDVLCSYDGLKTPYTDRYGIALLCLEIVFFEKFSSSPGWEKSLMQVRNGINSHYSTRALAPASFYSALFFGASYHNTLSQTQKETWNIFYAACCQGSYARYQIVENQTVTLRKRTIAVLEMEAVDVGRQMWVCDIPWILTHFQWAVFGLRTSKPLMTQEKIYHHFQRLQPQQS